MVWRVPSIDLNGRVVELALAELRIPYMRPYFALGFVLVALASTSQAKGKYKNLSIWMMPMTVEGCRVPHLCARIFVGDCKQKGLAGGSSFCPSSMFSVSLSPFETVCPVLAFLQGRVPMSPVPRFMPSGLHRTYGAHHLHFMTCSCYCRLPGLGTARLEILVAQAAKNARTGHPWLS